jgi:SAM-dependent methyltransferase
MTWPFEIAERDHTIQNPTSAEKILRLGRCMRLDASSTILDLACGKGEPAILLAAEFGCRVTGVELRPAFADAARERAATAGLAGLIDIHTADASTVGPGNETFDAAMCLGAAFVWGHIGDAVAALRPHVRAGGFVAVGEPFWRTWPLPESVDPQAFVDLASTAGHFKAGGVSLVGLVAGSEDDWDHYESLHWRAIDEWLADNPGHPDAPAIRAQHERFRSEYLRHARALLGWAIFVGRRR